LHLRNELAYVFWSSRRSCAIFCTIAAAFSGVVVGASDDDVVADETVVVVAVVDDVIAVGEDIIRVTV